MEIIILSSVVSLLFAVFIIGVVKEAAKGPSETEDNVRANFVKKVGKIFDHE
jgi:hypothetical protein